MIEFMKENGTYQKHMQHFLYHCFLIVMCGTRVAGKMAETVVRSNDHMLLARADHTERYQPSPNGELQSEGLGQEDSVSIEGRSLLIKAVGTDEFKKVLYAHCSDDKHQNAATVMLNILYMLDDIDKRKEMPSSLLKRIIEIVDGCAVQYRCGTVLYSLALLAQRRRTRLTRLVQAPGHGKAEIDGALGTDKTYGDSVFDRQPVLAEDEDEEVDIWAELREPSTLNEDNSVQPATHSVANRVNRRVPIYKMEGGKKLSLAKRVYEILSDPNRTFSQSLDKRVFKERRYHHRPVSVANNHRLKMTAVGFPDEKRSGMGSTYCFMADPDLGLKIAACRFFCGCKGCEKRYDLPSIEERYEGAAKECKFWEVFKKDDESGYNDPMILSFVKANNCNEKEYNETLEVALNDIGMHMSSSVVEGHYGAYSVDHDKFVRYYLVQWVGTPRKLEQDEVVDNDGELVQLFKDEWVCDGIWLNNVERAKYWYWVGDKTITVRMKNVLHSDLEMKELSADNPLPRMNARSKETYTAKKPIKLDEEDHDELMNESHRRDEFDYEEEFVGDDDSIDYDSEEEEEVEGDWMSDDEEESEESSSESSSDDDSDDD